MTDSLGESTQRAAPAAPKRRTKEQMEAELFARREANRAKAAAVATQFQRTAAAGTLKRPRSPSPETTQKRTRDAVDLDQLTPIEKVRSIGFRALDFPTNRTFKCAISVDQQAMIGSIRPVKGYSITLLIDEGRYGLPHVKLVFKSNKPNALKEDLASSAWDQEEFSISYHPGMESTYGNKPMIAQFAYGDLLTSEVELDDTMDKQMLQTAKSDTDREKLIRIMFNINKHEVHGSADKSIWLSGLGLTVAANMNSLFSGEYVISVWTLRSPGLLKALDSFHLAFQARLPLLHQYFEPDLSVPVLDLDKTPPIEKVGNGMYVIYPKKVNKKGQEIRDAVNKPAFDTTAPPIGYHSLPFIKDWVDADHFMIYNGLNVIREYHFQRDQIVKGFVDFKVFIKKMPGFRFGTEVLRADSEQHSPNRREITSLFLIYFRTLYKEGVKQTPPQEGTRVSITIPMHAKSEDMERLWKGLVIRRDPEELKSTGCDFCVLASKVSNVFYQPAHDELKLLPDGELQNARLKISHSNKPALRELEAVKALCTSDDSQLKTLRDLLIQKANPNRQYPTVDITGGPNKDKKLKRLFSDRVDNIQGLNDQQKRALKALQNIPMGIHVVEGPRGTGKTSMIANTVWPFVEVGHRVCCFATSSTLADHLTHAVTGTCPPELQNKLAIRIDIAAVEDLLIKRSSQFDDEIPDDEQSLQPTTNQQSDEPENEELLFAMGVEHINQTVMEIDALFEQSLDELTEPNTTREEAFRLLQVKANQGGKLNIPLATTLAYRIWEMEMQDHIATTREYEAESRKRTDGELADMRSIDDRNPSSQLKQIRELYFNQDGQILGASRRKLKQLTQEIAKRVMDKVSILIITANNAGNELTELGFKPTLLICQEGGQANIANFCVPLTSFTRWQACLIFGDTKQLQPPVFNTRFNEVSQNGKLSILELLDHKGFPSHKLEEQYCMDPDIALFPNLRFYQGKLKNGPNTRESDPTKDILRRISKDVLEIRASTFWIVDVQNGVSRHEAGSTSLQNYANADAIYKHVSILLDQGIQASQITILVYYRAQSKILAHRLRRIMADGTTERMYSNIKSVGSFHGNDSDIIILDMVTAGRTSWIGKSLVPEMDDDVEEGEVEANAENLKTGESRVFARYTEYAKNCHRLNVACTRASKGLIVFCHTKSMLATSRLKEAMKGLQDDKSDLAALARNAQDRGIVYRDQRFESYPESF